MFAWFPDKSYYVTLISEVQSLLESILKPFALGQTRAVEITYNVILDLDQRIYFYHRSDQGQIIFVMFYLYLIKIS